jgi:hypothetical protein
VLDGFAKGVFDCHEITICVIGKALFGNREFHNAKAKPGARPLGAARRIFCNGASRCHEQGCDGFAPFYFPIRKKGKK